jgi:hypothetical protein
MNPTIGKVFVAGMAIFVGFSAAWSAEFNYDSYRQSTLREIITEEQTHSIDLTGFEKPADYVQLEYQVLKYRVSCGYSAIRRPISEKKKNVIRSWMKSLDIDPALATLYRHEIRVTEGGYVLWIPIQEKLLPHIDKELTGNDTIELFIMFIGKDESGYVFIATEFETPASASRQSNPSTTYLNAAQ